MREDVTKARRQQPPKAFSTYQLAWVGLAAFSLGYLCVAAAKPELLASVLPIDRGTDQRLANRAGSPGVDDQLTAMHGWIKDLRQDVAETKSAIARHEERLAATEKVLPLAVQQKTDAATTSADKLAARFSNESAIPNGTPPVQAAAKPAQATKTAKSKEPTPRRSVAAPPDKKAAKGPKPQPEAGFEETIAAAIKPEANPYNLRVLNSGQTSQITTGSVPPSRTATPAFPPAQISRSNAQPQAIEIASAESLDALRNRWGEIRGRTPALRKLAPRYRITADGAGAPFRLLAGPFTEPGEAARACSQLKARGYSCALGYYTGTAL